jgi:copper(I)-binding protein
VSPVRRRGLSAAALAVTAGLTLSACGTSFGAQTNQVYQPAVGANARGDVDSHNTQLVGNGDGSATLTAALVNNLDEEQTLTSVEVTDDKGDALTVRSPKTALPLPSGTLVTLGRADTAVYIVTEGAEPGDYVDITLTFSDSGPLSVKAPVVARADHAAEYEDVAGRDGLVPSDVSGGGEQD